mgnify:FL=1
MKHISIKELIKDIEVIKFVGNRSHIVSKLISLNDLMLSNGNCPNALCWVGDDYVDRLKNLKLKI